MGQPTEVRASVSALGSCPYEFEASNEPCRGKCGTAAPAVKQIFLSAILAMSFEDAARRFAPTPWREPRRSSKRSSAERTHPFVVQSRGHVPSVLLTVLD